MLQYILTESNDYSIAELAQMAIEGGCRWINLHLPDKDDSQLRQILVPEVVEMCREAGVFLTVDDRPALARELGLHGVRITIGATPGAGAPSPAALRDELGPEAVIGVETADPTALPAMAAADIDFVCTPPSFDDEARRRFIAAAAASGARIPVVAQGDINPGNARPIIDEGFSGIAVGEFITKSASPVDATARLLHSIGD